MRQFKVTRSRRPWHRLLPLAVAVSVLLFACDGVVEDTQPPDDEPVVEAPAPEPAPEPPDEPVVPEEPQYGGRLRAALIGGGPIETLDPHRWLVPVDTARLGALYEPLTRFGPDGEIEYVLAESMESNDDATVWTVRLRPNVIFHDGDPLTADDVIYTWNRILGEHLQGSVAVSVIDLNETRRIDDLTIETVLSRPHAEFPLLTADVSTMIVRDGWTDFEEPNGTGPFRFVSWSRGERSLFARHEDYWVDGLPYLDELEIISMADPVAQANALLAGDIDMAWRLPPSLANEVEDSDDTYVVVAEGSGASSFYMRMDTPPFDDARVREAFKLAIDREQCVSAGLQGFGEVANDLFGLRHLSYHHGLPQRTHDPDRAQALLEEAGVEDLRVELVTARFAAGLFECSAAFRESASEAGITIDLREIPPEDLFNFDAGFLTRPFGGTGWRGVSFQETVRLALLCGSFLDETGHCDPEFDAKFQQAEGTVDPVERQRLYDELQQQIWEQGGYIIWGHAYDLNGFRANVHGPNYPVMGFEVRGFTEMWIAEE